MTVRDPHTIPTHREGFTQQRAQQDGWQHVVEGLFKATDTSPAFSQQLTALLEDDHGHTPKTLAETIAATSQHIRQHASQPVSELEWPTPLGLLRVPVFVGGGAAIHSTATHAVATTVLQLQHMPPHPQQQPAVRLCNALLTHLGLLEPATAAVAGFTIAYLLQQSADPLPLLHDLVNTWCHEREAPALPPVLGELLQASSLLPTLHALLMHDATSCRDATTFHTCASICQLWGAVVSCAADIGLHIEPRHALSALRHIARGMRRATLRVKAEHTGAQHWPPYAIMCFSYMAHAAAVAAHYGMCEDSDNVGLFSSALHFNP